MAQTQTEIIPRQDFNAKHSSPLTPKMSDQEVTYSTLMFLQSSSELQNRSRPDATQRPRKAGDKEGSVPWRLIAITFGIFCLLLLMTMVVLVTQIFQHIKEKHQQQEILENLLQKYHIMQNGSYLKEQLLTNNSLLYDILQNENIQHKKELYSHLCHRENMIDSKSSQCTGKLREGCWSCCGVKCYYFTIENKDWNGCKQTCQRSRSSLLKIDDHEELNFLRCRAYHNHYWIGLFYNTREEKWKWVDSGTSYGSDFNLLNLPSRGGKCAFLSAITIHNTECAKTYNCICEIRIDSILPSPM